MPDDDDFDDELLEEPVMPDDLDEEDLELDDEELGEEDLDDEGDIDVGEGDEAEVEEVDVEGDTTHTATVTFDNVWVEASTGTKGGPVLTVAATATLTGTMNTGVPPAGSDSCTGKTWWPTTPTIVDHGTVGPPRRMCLPTGSSFGQYCFARVSSMTITGWLPCWSWLVNTRPLRRGILRVAK